MNLEVEYELAIKRLMAEGHNATDAMRFATLDFKPKVDEWWKLQKNPLPPPPKPKEAEEDTSNLVHPKVFKGKEASKPETIEWAAKHIGLKVEAKQAPSAEAWNLLMWARENETSFWPLYMKLKQEDEQMRRMDDGREVLATIDRMEHAIKQQEATTQ